MIRPPDASRAATAFVHDAGSPIRMAVAIVSGCSIRWPTTSGAAPAAWKPHIRGVVADEAGRAVLAEARPVGADVAGVADRDGEDVGRAAEVVADLEGGGLLALEAERVDRVDQRDRVVVLLGEGADDPERLVEVAVDGDDPGPGDQRLEQLADGDLALGRTTMTSSPAAAP